MKPKYALLKGQIKADIEKIDHLFEKFELSWDRYREVEEYAYLVESAFYINQVFNRFERMFKNIAASFENNIDESSLHKSLLERMTLSIENIRPAVITGENFKFLDELRAFRHVFLYTYDLDLDKEKFTIVATRALKLKDNFKADINAFLGFIDELSS